jgi:hypothetical protein
MIVPPSPFLLEKSIGELLLMESTPPVSVYLFIIHHLSGVSPFIFQLQQKQTNCPLKTDTSSVPILSVRLSAFLKKGK